MKFRLHKIRDTLPAPAPAPAPAPTLGNSGFTVGQFSASYYNNLTFVASETVKRPTINYSWSDFHGIDANNFRAIWSGRLEVTNTPQTINMNFDVSWSDVSLSIDGSPVNTWSNSNMILPYQFSVGIHDIVIEYINNWHTAGFNVSFTNNANYSMVTAASQIAPLIDSGTKIIYVGDYESGDRYNNTTITLQNTAASVFLFLSSYNAQNWIIDNPNGVTIKGIAYGSYAPGSTVTYDTNIPSFEISGLRYGYDATTLYAPIADIQSLTGRTPDYTFAAYSPTSVVVTAP